ncbi:unnamed protein product [Prorocentrum cordatum]|uniref:Uncharacterized protein n=1 Tax=Prorocentrum cordatum TaxID=2364126 RepID=A0ABN9R8K9_9DINO|nr:unnamed protein product [Polarella glacialis]
MAAPNAAPAGAAGLVVWPPGDCFRLVRLLEARCLAATAATCRSTSAQLQGALSGGARAIEGGSTAQRSRTMLEAQQALADLDGALGEAEALRAPPAGLGPRAAEPPPLRWQSAWENLQLLEESLHTEMRYVYGPDWEMKPGKLVSLKGTWLKTNTRFSWELSGVQKLYLPQGVIMPVMQIGRVADRRELQRHEWVSQHLRVWMRPPIIRTLESRCDVWFVYWPHWQDQGVAIVPTMARGPTGPRR